MSSGESGDDSGSEDESPATRAPEHASSPQTDCEIRDQINSTSSEQSFGMSGVGVSGMNSGLGLPAMLCRPNMQMGGPGLEGLPSNLALGNLTMGYPHGVIIGLANQMAEGSSTSQPQFITIPLSMAMAAAGEAAAAGLQDLSRAQTLTASSLQEFSRAQAMNTTNQQDVKPQTLTFAGLQDFSRSQAVTLAGFQDLSRTQTMTVSGLQDFSRSQTGGSGNLQDLSMGQTNATGLQDLSKSATGSSGGGRK